LYSSSGLEQQRGGMQCRGEKEWDERGWSTGWHCRPHSYEQLTRGQLKKCRGGAGQKWF